MEIAKEIRAVAQEFNAFGIGRHAAGKCCCQWVIRFLVFARRDQLRAGQNVHIGQFRILPAKARDQIGRVLMSQLVEHICREHPPIGTEQLRGTLQRFDEHG